jgi:hypothetical protein
MSVQAKLASARQKQLEIPPVAEVAIAEPTLPLPSPPALVAKEAPTVTAKPVQQLPVPSSEAEKPKKTAEKLEEEPNPFLSKPETNTTFDPTNKPGPVKIGPPPAPQGKKKIKVTVIVGVILIGILIMVLIKTFSGGYFSSGKNKKPKKSSSSSSSSSQGIPPTGGEGKKIGEVEENPGIELKSVAIGNHPPDQKHPIQPQSIDPRSVAPLNYDPATVAYSQQQKLLLQQQMQHPQQARMAQMQHQQAQAQAPKNHPQQEPYENHATQPPNVLTHTSRNPSYQRIKSPLDSGFPDRTISHLSGPL